MVLRRDDAGSPQAGEGHQAPAVLGLLYRLGPGFARVDSRSRQDRRHAVQVGLGHGHQSLGAAGRGRHPLQRRPRSVGSGKRLARYKARDLMGQIAEATHQCGDPGMQFDGTVNRWNPCKNTARINASNPCSEYMFLDDSACNLASMNLAKFVGPDGQFDVDAYRHAVDTLIVAQEIIVDNASYPTEKIALNSRNFRPLGLGYANLGALLMSMGIPYDSDQGRAWAGALTSIMCGQAYLTSARLAEAVGPFPYYPENEQPFLEVIGMHRDAVAHIHKNLIPTALYDGSWDCWNSAYQAGTISGYRNAQVTVIAPTGTIGSMMDCDTTGIEPDLALVKYKKL